MFEGTFGLMPRKKVIYDGRNIKIKKESIPIRNIKRIYFQSFNFSNNDWGAMYFSLTGVDNMEVINNREVNFTSGQTEKALELLNMLDIEIIDRNEVKKHSQDHPGSMNDVFEKSIDSDGLGKNVTLCPNCSSPNIHFIENKKKNFSLGKAAGGALLTGGIGTLAGFVGKKGKKDLWHCGNCGSTFELKRK